MKSSVFLHALLLLKLGVPFILSAESGLGTWTNWRGSNYYGSQGQEGALPEKFGPEEGVRWKCSLPGSSAATPIIDSSRVFLSSVTMSSDAGEKQGDLVALCLDRFTG